LKSSYGFHFVFVRERTAECDPELPETLQAVELEWTAKRRKEEKVDKYKKLLRSYSTG
jgi:hypothetical protein